MVSLPDVWTVGPEQASVLASQVLCLSCFSTTICQTRCFEGKCVCVCCVLLSGPMKGIRGVGVPRRNSARLADFKLYSPDILFVRSMHPVFSVEKENGVPQICQWSQGRDGPIDLLRPAVPTRAKAHSSHAHYRAYPIIYLLVRESLLQSQMHCPNLLPCERLACASCLVHFGA